MRLLIFTVMAMSNMAVTSTDELDWSTSYGRAKTKAASAQRPLLVVIENPNDASSRLDEAELAASDTQNELIKRYELCRVDASTTYGQRVADAFGVEKDQLPYTAITDKSVKYITYRKAGPMSADQWTRALSTRPVRQVRFVQPRVQSSFSQPMMSTGRFCRT